MIDVSTPATVVHYTGNWKGSMGGWLLTPTTGYRQLPNTMPGLQQFLMVGHWIMPRRWAAVRPADSALRNAGRVPTRSGYPSRFTNR